MQNFLARDMHFICKNTAASFVYTEKINSVFFFLKKKEINDFYFRIYRKLVPAEVKLSEEVIPLIFSFCLLFCFGKYGFSNLFCFGEKVVIGIIWLLPFQSGCIWKSGVRGFIFVMTVILFFDLWRLSHYINTIKY